jgi:PIN domain nuclease of toxin-antitoxin system
VGIEPLILLDTHVAVWWLAESPGLSNAAKRAIRKHSAPGQIAISAISVLEIVTAVRRGRLQFTVPVEQWLMDMRCIPEVRLEPVSAEIAALAGSLPEPMHGDPADRLIVATASVLGMPLVTADEKLRSLATIPTIW